MISPQYIIQRGNSANDSNSSNVRVLILSLVTNIDENVSILEIFVPEQDAEFNSILIVIYNS